MSPDQRRELRACIDWSNPREILAHGFTVLQMTMFHPKLDEFVNTTLSSNDRRSAIELFLNQSDDEASEQQKIELLREWYAKGLFLSREQRYCVVCQSSGHTKGACPAQANSGCSEQGGGTNAVVASVPLAVATASAGKCVAAFHAHIQALEQQKLLEEKLKKDEKKSIVSLARQTRIQQQQQQREGDSAFAMDERRRGVVTKLEKDRGVGFVSVAECGEVRFFLDRTDYGLKDPAVNDLVTLKLDLSREIPTAVEVRPEKAALSLSDVQSFLERCRSSVQPIKLIETLLLHRHEWSFLVSSIASMDSRGLVSAVNTLVALTTFIDNREPVHLTLLRHFLSLISGPVGGDTNAPGCAFFPNLCLDVFNGAPAALGSDLSDPVVAQYVDGITELSNLVYLFRQFSDVDDATVIAPLSNPLEARLVSITESAEALINSTSAGDVTRDAALSAAKMVRRRTKIALQRIRSSAATLQQLRTAVFPSAQELSLPPPLSNSPFSPLNLPVNVATRYKSSEELIEAQCKLLRADTFEATCRVLAAACFQLPHYKPTAETLADVEHARIVHNVTFCGRVPTRDRDFSQPNSFLFYVEPKTSKANLRFNFSTGSCVCITTGQDRTVIDPTELFWGLVSSCDPSLLKANIIVVSPCDGNDFTRLAANLKRNELAGKTAMSMMLEVPLFLAGYRGVVQALLSFVGPGAMPLPMSSFIVDENGGGAQVGRNLPPVAYIPAHARFAFERLVADVRSSYALDQGQDEAMRRLSTSEMLLVQGPPGTGKSFIGARIVEVYIRFKQLVASGDILATVDVDLLTDTKMEKITPRIGPVVVITYKNHALDEFLMDLMRSGLWNSERQRIVQTSSGSRIDLFPRGRRIVRVGGRSREPELQDYNLNVLMAAKTDKQAVFSFRDRIYLMNSRLERLAKEIQLLEKGKVPRTYFEKWLTDEQRQKIRYEDREEWLAGKNYIGRDTAAVSPTYFLELLQTEASRRMAGGEVGKGSDAPAPTQRKLAEVNNAEEEDEDVQLSVFQEMRREDESRETNDNLHNIYISAEALYLATPEGTPQPPADVPQPLMSLWSLSPKLRHEYYAFLIKQSIAIKVKDCSKIMDALMNMITLRSHALEEARLELLQGADVIGFTTTGCAMHQNLLRSLRPSVLVVEEAAEVLESQLLACMTDSLKQIVLIGDHYQLKPKVDTFAYEKHNNLNVSMFERLAAKMRPIRLVEQRRMHPRISALVRPFYDEQRIEDHASVLRRPFVDAAGRSHPATIPGLGDTRLFLWEHTTPEETAPNSRSKINTLELSMCVGLVEHIVSEGVHPKSITVITPYLGQCRALRNSLRLRTSNQLRDVKVSTVDLYQGDENDIIVLSMVRTQKLTEFLRMRNRMIVSCSRARFAFIIVGSSALLEQSPHWKQVLAMLRERQSIGTSIPLSFNGEMRLVKNDAPWPSVRKSAGPTLI